MKIIFTLSQEAYCPQAVCRLQTCVVNSNFLNNKKIVVFKKNIGVDSNTEPPQVDANDLTNKLHSQLLLKHTGLHKIIINKKKLQFSCPFL